jgi:hypothetical protein
MRFALLPRAVVALAAAAALTMALSVNAGAGRECDGIDVCVSVRGPWVVVPASPGAARQPTYYQLSCPRRYVVGGLDAVVSDRGLNVEFLGILGSPVNPGITTSTSVVFAATPTGSGPATFTPLIGCIPTSGGGRGTTSVGSSAPKAVPVGKPTIRRVRTVRLGLASNQVFRHRCGRNERLVSSSAAVAFRRPAEPSAALLTAVSTTVRTIGQTVVVRVKLSSPVPASARPELQIHALCARGRP